MDRQNSIFYVKQAHKTGINVHLTHEHKVKPTGGQRRRLFDVKEEDRRVYNKALEQRIRRYKEDGESVTLYDQMKTLTKVRAKRPKIAAGHAVRQRGPLKRLDRAFQAFYRRVKAGETPGFPKFKAKKHWNSIEIYEQYDVRDGRFYSKDFPDGLRFNESRPIPKGARHCGATIKLTPTGWYVYLKLELSTPEPKPIEEVTNPVGIDMGLNHFAVNHKGQKLENPRFEREAHAKTRRLQRKLARAQRGSNSRRKKARALAKHYRKVTNQRKDRLHKKSTMICCKHDLVAYENLNVEGMKRNKRLARSISDAGWSRFLAMIGYKAEKGGIHAIGVNPRNTSQECSECGVITKKSLADRVHVCKECGYEADRDVNAARNILIRAGTALLSRSRGHSVRSRIETWLDTNSMASIIGASQ